MHKEGENQPQQSKQPESQQTPHEGGNGSRGLPPTIHERAKPPPESVEAPAQGGSQSAGVQRRGRPRTLDDPLAWEKYYKKQLEASRAYKKANRDKVNEQRRRRYKERKEQGKLPPKKQQPTQVYPPPAQQG
jgi:hypothetical protein